MGSFRLFSLFASMLALTASVAHADPVNVRWTAAEDSNAELNHVLDRLNSQTGLSLKLTDFLSIEDLDLATSHFQYLAQTAANVPIKGMSLRIWSSRQTGETVQVEAMLENQAAEMMHQFGAHAHVSPTALIESVSLRQKTMKLARDLVAQHADDRQIRSIKSRDLWSNGEIVREFTIRASHGTHLITVSLAKQKVVSQTYETYPQGDTAEYSIPVQVYQIYEETDDVSQHLDRIASELKYVKSQATRVDANPYTAMQDRQYLDFQFDPVLGMTEAGRAQGFWSMTYIKQQAAKLREQVAKTDNTFLTNGEAATSKGVILEGRYATINLHPAAVEKFGPALDFTPGVSAQLKPDWVENPDGSFQMIPKGSFLGRPLASLEEALARPARRLPDHDPASYLKDGFDEIQVYWAITTLFDELAQMGFNDPELSTRPFNAFLYDPDISMRNNAYYTDDTINFTTYSGDQQNMARDNSTIWHELGHGVMDRLMGDMITLADTGGLSEGMADFVAELVVEAVTNHVPFPGHENFRIINQTGFNLTNEVHDDGEAYGGTMRDLLVSAIEQQGRPGLVKVSDLTMETMRLTRDNPALTAGGWFTHMLFADQLGRPGVREPGELHDLIQSALASRNFDLQDQGLATYTLKADGVPIVAGKAGARDHEIRHTLGANEKVTHHMSVELKDGDKYKFVYPVTVSVEFRRHALQGAIHWDGEESSNVDYVIEKAGDVLNFDLTASGVCDAINRPDGTCSDYAYVQIINKDGTRPVAKKRFYLRILTQQP